MMRSLSVLTGVMLLAMFATAHAQSLVTRYVAGDDYQVVANAPEPGKDGPIHVTEFFAYSCPHCYHFEPRLERWVSKHQGIEFDRVPVLFGEGGMSYARLYYTERALGVTDSLHKAIFDAIHQDGQPLATAAAQRAFLVAHGVDGKRFDAVYNSDAVSAKVRAVADRMRHFRVTAVPSMAVGDRYWVSGRLAGDNTRMLDVVDYLVVQAKARRAQ
ncbi:thiol:disulfide interchange protein DsbA/DsbL [Salinisphaera sp. Q1T1-3]|uniref:thiol:disulfide interchange protein DsbA/DsbL n=1 Tax=Salinisphaera sp. Q1T1-3 TaxID=2321229 RepID=UPI000E72DA82|nr:thiol:disulfide interchange protein DsbA/DsbL [Salinisphaera sp. Q1T1-3]RJS92544.1 thiol:disulfide interchange protein DsbA/DsbL [Salinisphaera sp. Q1T1-3]